MDGHAGPQRLSVLLCANADGSEKLPPLVAGKSAKPVQAKLACPVTIPPTLRVVYTRLWPKYLKALDTRMAAESRRVLLLAGRLAAQSLDTSGLRHVQLAFFPPGTVQPAGAAWRGPTGEGPLPPGYAAQGHGSARGPGSLRPAAGPHGGPCTSLLSRLGRLWNLRT